MSFGLTQFDVEELIAYSKGACESGDCRRPNHADQTLGRGLEASRRPQRAARPSRPGPLPSQSRSRR